MFELLSASIFFFGIVGILALSRKLLNDYINPVIFYGSIWLVLFAAYSLQWIEYIDIEIETWLLIGGAFVCFVTGAWIIVLVKPRRIFYKKSKVNWALEYDSKRFQKWIVILFVFGMVGFYLYMSTVLATYNFSIFFDDPTRVRALQSTSEFNEQLSIVSRLLVYCNMFVVSLVGVYFAIFGFKKRKLWLLLIGLLSLLTTVFMMQRLQFFSALILTVLVIGYLRPRNKVRLSILIKAFVFVWVLIGFFVFIALTLGKTLDGFGVSNANIPKGMEFVAEPYYYLTGTIPTFQEYINDSDNEAYTMGTFTLLPLTSLLSRSTGLVEEPMEVAKFYSIPMSFNATGYLNVYFYDWGIIGILVVPFLIGLGSMTLYVRLRVAPSLRLVYFNAIVGYCLIFSVYANRFNTVYIWEFIIISYFIFRDIRLPQSKIYSYYMARSKSQSVMQQKKAIGA